MFKINLNNGNIFFGFLLRDTIQAVSSLHFMLLRLCPLIINHVRNSSPLNIVSIYKPNKSTEKTHHCLTALSSFVYSLDIFIILNPKVR